MVITIDDVTDIFALGVKKAVLVSPWVFNLKRATAGAFSVPFRELIGIYHSAFLKFTSRRYSKQSSLSLLKLRKCVVLESLPLLGVKKFSSHAHKTRSWYLIGVHFKISDEETRPLDKGVPTASGPP